LAIVQETIEKESDIERGNISKLNPKSRSSLGIYNSTMNKRGMYGIEWKEGNRSDIKGSSSMHEASRIHRARERAALERVNCRRSNIFLVADFTAQTRDL